MKIEKIVGLIAWIPISLVALLVAPMFVVDLLRFFYTPVDYPGFINPSDASFINAMGYIVLFAAAVMTIAGEVILARHGYGTKKFWKHYAIWSAAYVVFLIGITILEGSIFNTLSDPPIIPFTIAFCLYPGIALLFFVAFIAAVRGIKKPITLIKRCQTKK